MNLSKNLNTSTIIIRNMGQNDLILLAGAGIAAYFLFSKRGDETLESYTPPPSYHTPPSVTPFFNKPGIAPIEKIPSKIRKTSSPKQLKEYTVIPASKEYKALPMPKGENARLLTVQTPQSIKPSIYEIALPARASISKSLGLLPRQEPKVIPSVMRLNPVSKLGL